VPCNSFRSITTLVCWQYIGLHPITGPERCIDVDTLDKSAVRRAFNRAAAEYDRHAVLQHQVCERLLSRLDYIRSQPRVALDLGAGTGQAARALLARYRGCRVIAADLSRTMLQTISRPRPWRRIAQRVQCDAEALPFADASVDLLVSASTFQWCGDLPRLFAEIKRVLSPQGVLLFATFGPDTLKELRQAWAQVDDAVHVHEFADMHELGDAMLNAGLVDPVVDTEWLHVSYAQPQALMRDLKVVGAGNASSRRRRGLRASETLRRVASAYPRSADGACLATYEVVYGHAWGSQLRPSTVSVAFDRRS